MLCLENLVIRALNKLDEQMMKDTNDLVKACEIFDGVEVPMQWNHEMNAHGEMASWLLAYTKDTLVGVLALFGPCSDEIELSGCVHPAFRTQGIWTRLVAEAQLSLSPYTIERQLFMCDRQSQPGNAFAKKKQLKIHHTEYAMKYDKGSTLPKVTPIEIIQAGVEDINDIALVEADSFAMKIEDAHHLAQNAVSSKTRTTYVGKINGDVVSICSISDDTKEAIGINGLAVLKAQQGKGYGKATIVELIKRYLKDDSRDILLDVDSVNAVAYQLYKGLGFKETQAVDYYY